MMHELNFWVLGGDLRQGRLARLLAEDGHRVHTYALEDGLSPGDNLSVESKLAGVRQADCVVLPLPVASGPGLLNAPLSGAQHLLHPILDALSPTQVICGGRVDPDTDGMAGARGLHILDYFAREELAVANAVPTALAVGHKRGSFHSFPPGPSAYILQKEVGAMNLFQRNPGRRSPFKRPAHHAPRR